MSLTIPAVNDAPVCGDKVSAGDKNQQQTGTIACSDVDDASLTISKVSDPGHGSANVATDGDWTYTPTNNYSGSDTFTFRANDGSANSNTANMALTINATNAAPLCSPDTSSGAEDADQTGTVTCTDVDDDPLTYSKGDRAQPRHRHRQPRRLLDLQPQRRLQRLGQLHVPRQRRQRELDPRGDVDHRHRGQRRPGVRARHQLGQRGRGPVRHPLVHGRRQRPADLRQGRRPLGRRRDRRPRRLLDLHPGPGLQRRRQLHVHAPTTAPSTRTPRR